MNKRDFPRIGNGLQVNNGDSWSGKGKFKRKGTFSVKIHNLFTSIYKRKFP